MTFPPVPESHASQRARAGRRDERGYVLLSAGDYVRMRAVKP